MIQVEKQFPRPKSVFGPAHATYEVGHHKVSWYEALGEFLSDAISSLNYSVQEVCLVIGFLTAHYYYFGLTLTTVMLLILAVLWMLVITYRPTIYAYQKNGGGAYTVIDDNIGRWVARVVAAALKGEYVLTVSVSTSAGAGAIVTMLPWLAPYRMWIALGTNVILWFLNRVGIQSASRIFTVPVLSFVASTITLGLGAAYTWFTGGKFYPTEAAPHIAHGLLETLSFMVFLHAFSNGCSALTGVEATSNGVTAFKSAQEAVKTLFAGAVLITIGTLSVLFATIVSHTVPGEGQAHLVLLAQAVFGMGSVVVIWMGLSGWAILFAAGSVAYADFPRVLAAEARNKEAPRPFMYEGQRALVFDTGCNYLFVLSSILIFVYQGFESPQIPLYSVGVFLAVAASQFGMALRWRRAGKVEPGESIPTHGEDLHFEPWWRWKMGMNIASGTITAVVLAVIAISKFHDGAWIMICLNLPALTFLQWWANRHYSKVAEVLRLKEPSQIKLSASGNPRAILAGDVTRHLEEAIRTLNGEQWLIHVWSHPERRDAFLNDLRRLMPEIDTNKVILAEAPYRDLFDPALAGIQELEQRIGRKPMVAMGSLETNKDDFFWQRLFAHLHRGTAPKLMRYLNRNGYNVTLVPFFVD